MLMILSLFISIAGAKESWFCTQESSKIIGNQVYACGVALALDEGAARAYASTNAKNEFDFICSMSSDCRGREFSVTPKRTTCAPDSGGVKCHRLLVFTLADASVPKKQMITLPANYGTATGKNGDYTMNDFWRDWQNRYLKPH